MPGNGRESTRARWHRGLNRPFYRDPAIFELDMERVIKPNWLFVGHESQILEYGDYFTHRVGDSSLIIIRGRENHISALHNVCRHRGSVICTEETGNAKRLVCPYHQWTYDTEGNLLNSRLMPEDFDTTLFSLHRAHVRIVEGLIFVNQHIGNRIRLRFHCRGHSPELEIARFCEGQDLSYQAV